MTRTQYKRRTIAYWTLLAIYTAILAVAVFYGWGLVKQYAVEYEDSQSSYVVENYIDELNSTMWNDNMETAAKKLANSFQSEQECIQLVRNSMTGGQIQLSKISDMDFEKEKYKLICNDREIGQVVFCEDQSKADDVKFGLLPWMLESESFDFSYMINGKTSVTVPAAYTVKLNGVVLGEEYITEKDIPYDVLEEYYDEYENLPTKVTYEADGFIGSLTPVVYDEEGNEFTINDEASDAQFLDPCEDSEISRLTDFAYTFIDAYAKFTGTKNFNSTYPTLKQYVKTGSDLAERMQQFYEGGSDYIHWISCVVSDMSVNGTYSLGGDFYVVDVTYKTTNYHDYKSPVEEDNVKRIVVVDNGTEILAVSVE